MAVTSFELQAIISALDNASKVFGKVSASAKKSGSGIKSAFKGAGTAFGTVRKGVQGVDKSLQTMGQQIPAMQAAFGALKGAMDLGRLGASFERVEERFGKFAEAAGGSESIFDAFQRGVGGTASKMDTMSISSGLLQAGLVGSAAEMEKVTTVASRLGDQTIGTADRIGAFSQLLKNQSIQLLDNFGISSGKVRERIGELQAETKGLSREQAFLTATFEQADAALAVLGPRTEDALTSFERTDAQMADLRVEIGQKLAPAMADLMGIFSSGLSIVSSLVDVFGGLGEKVVGLVSGAPILGDIFTEVFSALDIEAAAKTAELLAVLGDSAKVAEGTTSEWGAASEEAMAQGASLDEVMVDLAGKTRDVSKAFDEGGVVADIFVDQTGILNDASSKAGQIALSTADDYDEYKDSIQAFNAIVPDASARITLLGKNSFESAKRIASGDTSIRRFSDSIQQFIDVSVESLVTQEAVTNEMERASPIWEASLRTQDRSNALQETAVSRGEAMGAAIEMVSQQAGASGGALEARNKIVEKAARVAEMQAASTLAAASALEQKRQKDIATATAEVSLAESMVDVTEAALAQTFIQGLDADAMGLTAYQAAVENIQLSFGLATPESIALSRGITQGLEAANSGALAYKDLDQFIVALKDDAADGNVDFDNLTRTFASSSAQADFLTQRITATGDAMVNNVAKTEALVAAEAGLEGVTRQAHDQMVGFGGILPNIAAANQTWTDSITGSNRALVAGQATAQQWESTMGGLDARMMSTGESLLNTGEKIEAVNAIFERGATPAEDATQGVGAVGEAHAVARVPVEEFASAVSEIPEGMDAAANAAQPAAEGVVDFGIVAGAAVDPVERLAAATVNLGNAMGGVGTPGVPNSASQSGGIPSFQTGGVMPFTGLANLHAGEIVLPPGQGTVTKNFNLTINTAAPMEPVLQDFATLEAMG